MKVFAIVLLSLVAAQGKSFHAKFKQESAIYWKNAENGKIVGGEEVVPYSVPWQVTLSMQTATGNKFCGGSLIKANIVLTAAHCLDSVISATVTAGDHNRQVTEGTEQAITSTTFIQHPKWNPVVLTGDLAIIKLPTFFEINEYVRPVPIAELNVDGQDLYVGVDLTVTGYGRTSNDPPTSPVLLTVTVPGISTADCRAYYGLTANKDVVCVSTVGVKSPCTGDSGGPLTELVNGVPVQVGITSFVSSSGCLIEAPAGFTRIASYRDWIDENSA